MSSASFVRSISTSRLSTAFLFAAALASGCTAQAADSDQVGVIGQANSLTQLPDCATVEVDSTFSATPSEVDGFYVVLDGTRGVCATDLEGLQTLAFRVDSTQAPDSYSAAEPMPGRGGDPAAAEPMPGRGGDPAASSSLTGRSNAVRLVRRVTQ